MIACPHKDGPFGGRVCPHLLVKKSEAYLQRFTGSGIAFDLVCEVCARPQDSLEVTLVNICSGCFHEIEAEGSWEGICGQPQVLSRASQIHFDHEIVDLPELASLRLLDVQSIEGTAGLWLGITSAGTLVEIDPIRQLTRTVARLPEGTIDFDEKSEQDRPAFPRGPRYVLRVSHGGAMAAFAATYGQKGLVIDLSTGQVTMQLDRGDYHADVSGFSLAFAEVNNRLVIIHSTEWNRLDISDARTGMLLTAREPTSYKHGEGRPEHYLDYFHGLLSVSPGQEFIVENGWVWHPVGTVMTWSLSRWLHKNVWESEDGPSKKTLCWRDYWWDGPLCWLDEHRLLIWGYGMDGEWLIPAICIFDARTGKRDRWFAGPKGSLIFDEYLFATDMKEGTTIWDITTGERILAAPDFCPIGYHRGARKFLSLLGSSAIRLSTLIC